MIHNACSEGMSFAGNDRLDKVRTEMSALCPAFFCLKSGKLDIFGLWLTKDRNAYIALIERCLSAFDEKAKV